MKLILHSARKSYEMKHEREENCAKQTYGCDIGKGREEGAKYTSRSTFIRVGVTIAFTAVLIIVCFHDIFLMASKPSSRR